MTSKKRSGHGEKLLMACAKDLQETYPEHLYEYQFEKGIPQTSRMRPDVIVLRGGKVICVAEIGYTDAKKLKAYREFGIPDIRWYTKKMEMVLCEVAEKHDPVIEAAEASLPHMAQRLVLEAQRKFCEEGGHLIFDVGCAQCEDDGSCKGEMEGIEFIYFNDKKYRVVFECAWNSDHDYDEEYKWGDDDGPCYGQKENYIQLAIEGYVNSLRRVPNTPPACEPDLGIFGESSGPGFFGGLEE